VPGWVGLCSWAPAFARMTEEGMSRSMPTLAASPSQPPPSFRGSAKPRARNPGTRTVPGWVGLCSWVPAFAGMTEEGVSRSILTPTASPSQPPPSFRGSAKPRARNPRTRTVPGSVGLCSWVPAFAGMTVAHPQCRGMATSPRHSGALQSSEPAIQGPPRRRPPLDSRFRGNDGCGDIAIDAHPRCLAVSL
jgi:hypothetical protein